MTPSNPVSSPQTSAKRLMTSADVSRLPLKKIEAALRKTTELLATELATPTETTPDWSDFEWCIARSVAAIHGVSPLLATTLRWRGPESWESFLKEQREHTFQRHQRITQLLADIGSQAVRDGVAIVPLKGAALHAIGIYQPGERPMSDVDLLVRSADVQGTTRLLGACGYHGIYATWKHSVFAPDTSTHVSALGEHANNCIKIELHTSVAERMPVMGRDISAMIFPPQPRAGLNGYPSVAALMAHLLLHTAGNICFNGLRLLHLHDIALLARRMSSSDWDAVLGQVSGQAPWWVFPPLALTAHYYPTAIPGQVIDRAESACSWLLRQVCRSQRLSDVSLSNLRIQAFPGIKWSHSPRELLKHVMSRVKPNKATLTERNQILQVMPSLAHFSWSHLSQWQRIVRWVFDRPPRVETLSSVWAALAQLDASPELTRHP